MEKIYFIIKLFYEFHHYSIRLFYPEFGDSVYIIGFYKLYKDSIGAGICP